MSQQPSLFLESIIAFLMPYFSIHASNARAARSEILDTIASYDTHTRAEICRRPKLSPSG
jgi:hypothetical protein